MAAQPREGDGFVQGVRPFKVEEPAWSLVGLAAAVLAEAGPAGGPHDGAVVVAADRTRPSDDLAEVAVEVEYDVAVLYLADKGVADVLLTALIGAPYFIFLIMRSKTRISV